MRHRTEINTRAADERMLEILHRRYVLGQKPKQIARDMRETRNAVIGICHRMLPHIEAAGGDYEG